MKKKFVSLFSALLLMVVLTTTAFAAPTAEKEHIRIKGTLKAVEIAEFNPADGSALSTATGSGKGAVLGKFTFSFSVFISPTSTGILYYHLVTKIK